MSDKSRNAGKPKKRRRRRIRKVIKWILLCILFLVIAVVVFLFIRLYPAYKEYSSSANAILMEMNEDSFRRSGNTYVYDKDDVLIGEIGNERYEYVGISDVSGYIVDGYIAAEDKRFMEHGGVDFKATARAVLKLIQNKGEITQGGSTITQQVVKNNFLTQEQTYERKFLEMILAMRLEKEYSKSQIMEFYVNSCYYGENCYGIEGASQYYFGVPASDLTLGEAAMLVATSRSPSVHNPVADYGYMLEEKDRIILEMYEEGYITSAEAQTAEAEEPEVVQMTSNVGSENYMVTYALHCAALELMERDGFAFEYTFDTSEAYEAYSEAYSEAYYEALSGVRSGGYRIYTSFDTEAQALLQKAVDGGLSGFSERDGEGIYEMQGAACCIDNSTGMVVAMVGGREAEGSYNRGYQAKRQPGSSVKPLLDYAPAVNEGIIWPDTVYNDAQFDDNGYSPSNAGNAYYGDVTVREAVARSLNTVALQVFIDTGAKTALSYLGQMEFSSLAYADSTMDGISIGGFTNGLTVADMASGYATLANGGRYSDATCLRMIETESGSVIYEAAKDVTEKQVFLSDTAYIATDMLEGVFREDYGTAKSAAREGRAYAGKTGTTNDSKDAWFCGYSEYYTTVVWTGYDMPETVEGMSGSSYPLTIWSEFMDAMHEGLEKKDFTAPASVYLSNGSGKVKTLSNAGDNYSEREPGYELRSSKLEQLWEQNNVASDLASVKRAAENAVSDFESWQIASYEDAAGLDEKYNSALEAISALSDPEEKAELLNRAAKKYELLSGDVADAWADAAEKIAEAEQAKTEADNEIAARQSIADAKAAAEEAAADTEAENVRVVEWYIDHLSTCQYYTPSVASMIADAKDALERCLTSSSYDSLQSRLSSAISRAESLPDGNDGDEYASSGMPGIYEYEDGFNTYDAYAYDTYTNTYH